MALVADYITVDWYGFECVNEEDLDAAYMAEDAGKALRLPPTCLEEGATREVSTLARAIGYEPTAQQWQAFSVRHLTGIDGPLIYASEDPILETGSLPCCTSPQPTPPYVPEVPISGTNIMLATAIAALFTIAWNIGTRGRS